MGLPITIYSDDDRAFEAEVKAFFESEMINQVITRSHAHVAERFIKTLKKNLYTIGLETQTVNGRICYLL